jgi:uncharacterized protein YuzE
LRSTFDAACAVAETSGSCEGIDFNSEGKMVGIEILDLSKRVGPERLRVVEVET